MNLTLFDLPVPSMPKIDSARCRARIIGHQTASAMVREFHYLHRVPPMKVAVGMYVDDVLAGVITYGTGAVPEMMWICGKENACYALELNRLYVHDWAGRNSESWLIGQSFSILRAEFPQYKILISYADTAQGHLGRVYQATNWLYTGYTDAEKPRPRYDYVLPGSTRHSREITQKGGAEVARANGAVRVDRSAKHRYVYFLGNKAERKQLRSCLRWPVMAYPKQEATP